MAGPYYVDPAAAGTNDGSSWTNAWTNVQSAFDTAAAGEIVYCRGEQDLAASIDVDTNSGDETSGFIKFIGCNASGVNDGTRFVLDGQASIADLLKPSAAHGVWIENFEFKNSTGDGIDVGTACNLWVFLNCCAHDNTGMGFNAYSFQRTIFIRCTAYSNGSDGFYLDQYIKLLFCSSHDNTGSGFNLIYAAYSDVIGCIAYDNGDDGYEDIYLFSTLFNCVSDGNADDGIVFRGSVTSYANLVVGCRITNHSGAGDIGLNANSEICIHGWNYFEANDGDNIQNSTISQQILDAGAATNVEDQSDTNQGYTSLVDGSEDLNLRSDASLRRTAITIPTA